MKNKLGTIVYLSCALGLAACEGDDGSQGPAGAAGATGASGANSLVTQTALPAGDSFCPAGGVRLDSGLDTSGDGVLDAGEVSDTSYVCNPGATSVGTAQVASVLNNTWFQTGAMKVADAETARDAMTNGFGEAKNVILFVGDGMGPSTVTAARILEGQFAGMPGEENTLSFGAFPYAGLAKTYNVDAQTPDSAGTMTAMMTGVKTDVGTIGNDEDIVRGDCTTVAGNELVTALELAELAGMSTGVVSTARITHATPAATYARSADRNWEDISDMPQEAIDAGCVDIADQLVNFEANLEASFGVDVDGLEVVMGGGRRHFLPNDPAFNSADARSATEGDRTDGRDLTAEWQALYPDGSYVTDQTGFDALDPAATPHVFALFNESHVQYEADRGNDVAGEPSLTEQTVAAIDILDNNPEGFFLMVESGRIDHGHHAGSAYVALTDTIEFARAIGEAAAMTDPAETLIIVTADHSHVMTIGGYPQRGNPILGKVVGVGGTEPALAADGLPHTTITYTNGRGFRDLGAETDADVVYSTDPVSGRADLTAIDTTTPGYHQETLVPLSSETHSAEDVGIYASGPGAYLVSGTNEQNMIFHVMNFAANLVGRAEAVLP